MILINGKYKVVCNQCGTEVERCCLCNVATCTNVKCVACKCDCDKGEKE